MSRLSGRIGLQTQSRFFRSVGAMLGAGMPLVSCLHSEEGLARGRAGTVARLLREQVEAGSKLSVAMGAVCGSFDVVVVGMIRAAESSGRLPETMARIADMQEAAIGLRKKIRSALAYPAMVLLIALAISFFLSVFILPLLAGLLEGRPVPWPTRLVMEVGVWIRESGVYVLVGVVMLGFLVGLVRRTGKGARFLHGLLLWMPVAGGIARKIAVARFARVFGSLVQGGVPVLKALDLSAGATGNKVIAGAVLRAREAVARGEPLSAALANERSIPANLVEMLRTGEKSGRVDDMLDHVAVYYERDVEAVLNMLPALIQPILIVFVGAIVLVIALSVFLPLWGMISAQM